MTVKRRAKGTGTLFKKSNGRYALRFEGPDGHISSMTLHDDSGKAITLYKTAVVAAEKICRERQHLQQIESKIDYLNQVAQAKQLITQATVELFSIWDFYLKQPNRPDSGENTLRCYHMILNLFLRYCKEHQITALNDLTEEVIGEYMVYRWRQGISARTYNKHLQALKLIFKTCLKDNSPFQNLKAKQAETEGRKPFTPEQVNAIFKTLDEPSYYMLYKPEMRIMLMLGLAFGLRLHDAACFQWAFIDGEVVHFKPAKTKRHLHSDLVLPIPPILQEQFTLAQTWKQDEYLLPHVAARYQKNDSGISQDIAKLLEASGIQTKEVAADGVRRQIYTNTQGERCVRHISRYSFHSFRHTFCSLAANAGNDLSVIRSIVGHTNVAMTEHYTHYSLESKRQVIASLPLPQNHTQDNSFEESFIALPKQKLAIIGQWLKSHLSQTQKDQLRELLANTVFGMRFN